MSEERKAVFLSYASQDADAARRICDPLRAAGVEVWFDQNELVGGDAWDAKIRGQIASCALFVPVISANTQARREGYFRLEWKLADERTHLMAEGTPFVLPVVIDDTKDREALVPKAFLAVQWTRLPEGETSPVFCARVKKLLGGEAGPRPSPAAPDEMRAGPPAVPGKEWRRRWLFPVLVSCAAIAALTIWRPWRLVGSRPARSPRAATKPMSEAQRLSEQARQLYRKVGFTRDDLTLAGELARKATELDTTLAVAWGARSGAESAWIIRNWDGGAKRRQDTQAFANRALALDPSEPEALIALGIVLRNQGAMAQAEELLRKAASLRPTDAHAARMLYTVVRRDGSGERKEEARAILEIAVKHNPSDPVLLYDLAGSYASLGGSGGATSALIEKAMTELDRALALHPLASAIILKAALSAGWRGDLETMRTQLDELSKLAQSERGEDRAVHIAMWGGLLERRSDRVLAAAALTARTYFEDFALPSRPKGWSTALAQRIAGKDNLARLEWQGAESTIRERLRSDADNLTLQVELAITLAALGRNEEASGVIAPVESAWREAMVWSRARLLAMYYAARGEAARAVPYLRQALNQGVFLTDALLRLDPWWDSIRVQPDFVALLAEADGRAKTPERKPASTALDSKSVAVLAFENKSDDPANELFSDGLSEDLIGALGRVPGLTVTGWTSSLFLKNKNLPTAEIGKQLGVAYVVRGSVWKSDNTVRITAQVSRAATDVLVWSSAPLERDVREGFKVRDEIAGLIAQNLQLKLGGTVAAAVNPEAMRLYLQGRQLWMLRTTAAGERAETLFREALRLDSTFVRARAGLVDTWMLLGTRSAEPLGQFERRSSPELKRIVVEAEAAVVQDPLLAEAHAALGGALSATWDTSGAVRSFRRAIELNPNYGTAHQWLGRAYLREGRMDEALVALKRAAELDPLAPIILDNYAMTLLFAGRPAEALPIIERAILISPERSQAVAWKVWALVQLDRKNESLDVIRQTRKKPLTGDDLNTGWAVAHALRQAGQGTEAAEFALRQSDDIRGNRFLAIAGSGQPAAALEFLDAGSFNYLNVHYLLFHPDLDPVRSNPRFQSILTTLGLTEAHTRAQAWRKAHPSEKPEAKK